MDARMADQLGRELAWAAMQEAGLLPAGMAKEAGLLEGLLYAPLTGIAALLSAPSGSRLRNMGLGILMGAGLGAVTNKEITNRQAQGEQVGGKEMSPAMRAIMAGVAIGGAGRVERDVKAGKPIEAVSAMLTGAPLGALLGSDPAKGLLVGAISGRLLSAFGQNPTGQNPLLKFLPAGLLANQAQQIMAQQAPGTPVPQQVQVPPGQESPFPQGVQAIIPRLEQAQPLPEGYAIPQGIVGRPQDPQRNAQMLAGLPLPAGVIEAQEAMRAGLL